MAVKGENIRNYGKATEENNPGHGSQENPMPKNANMQQTGKTSIVTLPSPGIVSPNS